MTVSVVLSQPLSFHITSSAIMWATGGDVSHASIHFDGDGVAFGGRRWVYEAVGHGVRLCPVERWRKTNRVRYEILFRDTETARSALAVAMHELGSGYDFAGVARFAVYLLARKIHAGSANWICRSTPDTLFCSEAVLRVVQVAASLSGNPQAFEDVMTWCPDATSPEDLKRLRYMEAFLLHYADPR